MEERVMIWDIFITLGSIALAVYFIWIEPMLRRWREVRAARQLPPPRNPPPETQEETDLDSLLRALVPAEYRVPEKGTGGNRGEPTGTGTGTGTGTDRQIENLIIQGYSGNQICQIVGGKRADVQARIRAARKRLGVK
jgi:hypothetical protein